MRYVINTNSQPHRILGNAAFRKGGAKVIAAAEAAPRIGVGQQIGFGGVQGGEQPPRFIGPLKVLAEAVGHGRFSAVRNHPTPLASDGL